MDEFYKILFSNYNHKILKHKYGSKIEIAQSVAVISKDSIYLIMSINSTYYFIVLLVFKRFLIEYSTMKS